MTIDEGVLRARNGHPRNVLAVGGV